MGGRDGSTVLGGDDIRTDVLISPKSVPQALGRLRGAIKALRDVAAGPQKRRLSGVLAAAEQLSAEIAALDEA